MNVGLLALVLLSAGCAPALTHQETAPLADMEGEVRVRAGDSIVQGTLLGAHRDRLAVRTAEGVTVELTGYDSLWVRREPVHPVLGVLVGAVVGVALAEVLTNATSGRDADNTAPAAAVGALIGGALSVASGERWIAVVPGRWGPRPAGSVVMQQRSAPVTAQRAAFAIVPANALVRIGGRFGTIEGRYAGVWNDSLRLADHRAGFHADSVRTMWVRHETSGAGIGGFLGLLLGGFGGIALTYGLHGDNPETKGYSAAVIIGSMVTGAFLGSRLGGLTEGWRQVVP